MNKRFDAIQIGVGVVFMLYVVCYLWGFTA